MEASPTLSSRARASQGLLILHPLDLFRMLSRVPLRSYTAVIWAMRLLLIPVMMFIVFFHNRKVLISINPFVAVFILRTLQSDQSNRPAYWNFLFRFAQRLLWNGLKIGERYAAFIFTFEYTPLR